MNYYKLILIILSISVSIFGQKDKFSSFSDGAHIIAGETVTNAEYERFKESLDDHHFGYSRIVRSTNRDAEFDIHINFDELETSCYWGGSVYPGELYQNIGVVFSNNGAVIDECGSFHVTGHSSPKFLGFNESSGYAAPQTISFSNPVSVVQINVGSRYEGQFTMTAYDAGGSPLNTSTVANSSALVPIFVHSPNSISSVIIEQNGGGYYVMDDLKVRTMDLSGTFQGDYYSAHTD
ncbi:uncharacterized protein METZ01_LOCUS421401, partial [marine metagenome]